MDFRRSFSVLRAFDLVGARFGRWTVTDMGDTTKYEVYLLCQCDCGTQREVAVSSLRLGRSTSCGCGQIDSAKAQVKHGHAETRVYWCWHGMMRRCYDVKHKSYERYGGRGVTVDRRWHDIEAFVADMGQPPDGCSLGRIDNDGPYCKDNCRWETVYEQQGNRECTVLVEAFGQRKPLAEWAREKGLSYYTVWGRIRKGWPPETALTERPDTRRRVLTAVRQLGEHASKP